MRWRRGAGDVGSFEPAAGQLRGARTWGKMRVTSMMTLHAPVKFRLIAALSLAVILGSLLGTGKSFAQAVEQKLSPLGATTAEIAKVYGPVLRHHARVRHHEVIDGGNSIFTGDLHGRNGIIIRAVYHKDRCVLLEYTRVDGALTAADVDAALGASVSGFAWEMGKDSTDATKFYHRTDGKAIANWATGYDGSLLVSTEDADSGFGNDLVR